MINHQKTFKTIEEVRKFVMECHEYSNMERQYRVAVNSKVYRAPNITEIMKQILESAKPTCPQCGTEISKWAQNTDEAIKLCPKCKGEVKK
jgi:predicted nucleic acid-binding Zn ribbon protein